jgi:proline iminopeptidase
MRSFLIISFAVFIINGCKQANNLSPREGYFHLKEGKVWYKIVGSGDKTPLLLLHGGPGVPSYYLNSMGALGDERPVIFLDQLGCGRSDRNIDSTLMTVESFVNELKEFTDSLQLTSFYLYGHSWGTMLAMDYYLKYPENIKAIIFASPCLSVPFWERDADSLINTLPDSIKTAISINERNRTFDAPAYQNAVAFYYDRFLAISKQPSPDRDSSGANFDVKTYMTMWGPSEFTATGSLKGYDRTGDLAKIKVPVLFMSGEFDEAVPSTVKYLSTLVARSKFEVVKNSAHLTQIDNPRENNRIIKEYLQRLDKQ